MSFVRWCIFLSFGCLAIFRPIYSAGFEQDSTHKNKITEKLARLLVADQRDREKNLRKLLSNKDLARQDLMRRKQVALLFAAGRLTTACDYLNAAMIYQHGTCADHYYQAYWWATRAALLEKTQSVRAKSVAALAIDRYLISLGRKQLFGSQFAFTRDEKSLAPCWCIRDQEHRYKHAWEKTVRAANSEDQARLISQFYGRQPCVNRYCREALKSSSRAFLDSLLSF